MLARLNDRRFDAFAFVLALGPRLAFLALWTSKGLGEVYGRDLYYSLAQSWLGWTPMPAFDATHPPLYTLLIAGVLGLFRSPNPLPVLLLQAVLGAVAAPLTRRVGWRLVGEGPARLAALWVALDPALIFFAPHLQTETLFVFMELLFFWGLVALWDETPGPKLVALGVWGGLTALCRSVFGAYPAFLFLALWRAKGPLRAFVFCAALGAGWFVPTGLWTARNHAKYGRVVPMSGQMGWTLWEGFSLDREEVRRRPYDMDAESKALGLEHPLDRGAHFMAKTKAFAAANPFEAARIVVGKALLYWRPFPYDPHSWWQRGALGVYYLVLFALGLVGARAALRRPGPWGAVWALLAYLTAMHSVFFTSLRYRLPLEPFLCLLAALGAWTLAARRRGEA